MSAYTRRGSVALLLVLSTQLAACESPTVESTVDAYSYWLPAATRVLRWPRGATIQVYVNEDRTAAQPWLGSAFDTAAAAWNDAMRYGEFSIRRTDRLEDANVVVAWWTDPLPVSYDGCTPRFETEEEYYGLAAVCDRQVLTDPNARRLTPWRSAESGEPTRVFFVVSLAHRLAGHPLLSTILTHELGHTLGVFRHSPVAGDIMSGSATLPVLSERDKATFRLLYHTRADITP